MEVESCSQVVTPDGVTMNVLPLNKVDVEEPTKLVKYEPDDVNAEKRSTDMEVTKTLANAEKHTTVMEETGTVPCEPKWLQNDEPIALWVKWRGKWQAGIRCAKADWPLTTLRGKPTHERKEYCVIFFPHTKNYSWADMQLVRSINEFPDPIAYKSHKIGLKFVKDLTSARCYVMRKLTVGMFNIVDQFPLEAVTEAAKDIIIWKELAMEATRSTSYHDLGIVLLKLHDLILQRCIASVWLQNSFPLWMQKCYDAVNAESIELLTEEYEISVEWNKVKKAIADSPMQPMVFSEWKTWKHDIAKWFSISRRGAGQVSQQSSESMFNSDVQGSHKRQKLEIRRAETTNMSQMESDTSPQVVTATDSEFYSSQDNNTNTPEVAKDENRITNTPENGVDLWGGIVVEVGGSQVMKTKEANELSSYPQVPIFNESVVKKPFDSGVKSQRCIAFIESKGRQCVRWANEGDVYCCVHLASRFTTQSKKNEGSPVIEATMCGGVTVLGTKCKHRALPGLLYCKKHRPQTGMEKPDDSSSVLVKRKVAEIMTTLETNQCQDLVPFEELESSSIVPHGTTSFTDMVEHCSQEDNLCVGSCSENSYIPCNEFSTKHTLYCEGHLPNWLKRARNGKSRIISKEVFVDLLRGCSSREEKLSLHQACDIFYKLFKSVLSLRNSVPMDVQLGWAIAEASRDADAGVGVYLFKLVSHEKQRLTRIWGFRAGDEEDASFSESPNQQLLAITNGSGDDGNKDEDKWSFSGFGCAICLDSFVSRKLLETHVEERHHVQFAEKCMLLQCVPCGSHFGDKEQLLLHVQAVHPSECKSLTIASECNLTNGESSQKPEAGDSQIVVSQQNNESTSGVHKFVCKFCGMKFSLLPDLGRHHQAEHMGPPDLVGSRGPKNGLRLDTYKMKSGRLSHPSKFKKTLGALSHRSRNQAGVNMKRRMQGSKSIGTAGPHLSDSTNFDESTDAHCSVVSNILLSMVQKAKHRPNNHDILSAARSACCRVSLESSLEAKFGTLPDQIYLKAAKLCGENGLQVQWHQEGFICSNGCKPVNDLNLLCFLIPREENDRFPVDMEVGEPSNTNLEVDECHCIMEAHHFSKRPENITVLFKDISFGKETVPICVVVDGLLESKKQHEKPWENFSYVSKSLLHPSMNLLPKKVKLKCSCIGSICSPLTCNHVYLFCCDFEEARDIYGKSMKFRFPYDDKKRIILEEGYPVYECTEFCGCSRTCRNRVLQNGVCAKLEVFRTESKGWGLRAAEHILRGTFVCEYIGEIVDPEEANKRRNRYGKEGCSYIHDIDANMNDIGRLIEGEPDFAIDATTYSNVSRFINHSCSPNLIPHQVLLESMESPLAHIGFYASMDIAAGEEITRDYGRKPVTSGQENEHHHPCQCKTINCRGVF